MAERRMFAKTIVLSDAFLDMPLSARCLYFTLGMLADDDGFVNSPKSIIRQCGASEDDLKVLLSKKFVLSFENGVIVIKHWRINNYLRNDRYKETTYTDEKSQLTVDEKGIYHFGIPSIGIPSIGKDSIGKDSIDNNIYCASKMHDDAKFEEDFKVIYNIYPKKKGKTVAFANYKLWVTTGKVIAGKKYRLTNRQIYKAVQRYVKQQDESGQEDLQYWKNFDTLMGRQLLDYVDWDDKK